MEIKDGNLADLPLIVEKAKMFNEMAKEGYGEFLSYDPKTVSENIYRVVKAGGRYWVLWDDEEDFAGIILGMISSNFYNDTQKVASCLFVAVVPDHQRTQWGSKLMEKFEDWAKESDAGLVAYTGYEPKFIRTMKRKGFKQIEVKLMREV